MINELDLVVLLNDKDAYGLKSGDVGTVVHCYQDKKGFEVEFVTADGQTIDVLTLTDTDSAFCAIRNTPYAGTQVIGCLNH
jgi:hypothetical protein